MIALASSSYDVKSDFDLAALSEPEIRMVDSQGKWDDPTQLFVPNPKLMDLMSFHAESYSTFIHPETLIFKVTAPKSMGLVGTG